MTEAASEDRGEDKVGLANLIAFVRRHLLSVSVFALLFGLLAFGWTLLGARMYQASALVVVTPASYSSSLRPGTFSVYGYQEILQSDAVVENARAALVESGTIPPRFPLQAGRNLRSEIFVAQRDQTSLAPMLRLRATADTAERAAALVNAWAAAMIEETRSLAGRSTMVSVSLIEARFAQAAEGLATLEAARTETRLAFDADLEKARGTWAGKLSAARRHTEDVIAAFQIATLETVTAAAAEHGLGKSPSPFSGPVESALQQLVGLHGRLAQTLPYVALERSVSDDVLWQEVASPGSPRATATFGTRLDDQEVNPLYGTLSGRLAETELEVRAQAGRSGVDVAPLLGALERARRERAAGLAKLVQERRLVLDRLRSSRDTALEALMLRFQQSAEATNRSLAAAQSEYNDLANRAGEAALARSEAETTQDLTLGLPAVPPSRPVPRGMPFRVFVGLVFGGMIGLLRALVRDVEG